ncbi:hypothetical protein M0811_06831 [Anaeramoeba ignava]|uniref:SPRY domain-containing protein n=1 Tax=Anaeramoeba ignava TaxID=1746090 RepID=A0A9Q0RDC3_ANAIG|nr:hypothetical protein M0811_06831 [Anaeramoeba ignava]|eukprot:Anaeramoba_ignava/a89827_166.p1 GENE.a89827_166~~a89827_166.p1  ORF type:complete len:776 (+),score=282.33 a89827_166:112-2439(+)
MTGIVKTNQQTEKLELTQEAENFFNSINKEKPIHILSIIGVTREGKSTLLNCISSLYEKKNSETKFEIFGGADACTSGIWVKQIELNDKIILLIDSEGTNKGNDVITQKIITLVSLLSSVLIINFSKTIKNDTFKSLSGIQSIAKIIKNPKRGNVPESPFPNLIFLLRDSLPDGLTIDKTPCNAEEYLNYQLDPVNHISDGLSPIAVTINSFYKKKQLFAFKKPSDNQIQQFKNGNFECNSDSEFDQKTNELFQFLENGFLEPKLINRNQCQGSDLFLYLKFLIEGINEEKVDIPMISDYIEQSKAKQILKPFLERIQQIVKELIENLEKIEDNEELKRINYEKEFESKIKPIKQEYEKEIQFLNQKAKQIGINELENSIKQSSNYIKEKMEFLIKQAEEVESRQMNLYSQKFNTFLQNIHLQENSLQNEISNCQNLNQISQISQKIQNFEKGINEQIQEIKNSTSQYIKKVQEEIKKQTQNFLNQNIGKLEKTRIQKEQQIRARIQQEIQQANQNIQYLINNLQQQANSYKQQITNCKDESTWRNLISSFRSSLDSIRNSNSNQFSQFTQSMCQEAKNLIYNLNQSQNSIISTLQNWAGSLKPPEPPKPQEPPKPDLEKGAKIVRNTRWTGNAQWARFSNNGKTVKDLATKKDDPLYPVLGSEIISGNVYCHYRVRIEEDKHFYIGVCRPGETVWTNCWVYRVDWKDLHPGQLGTMYMNTENKKGDIMEVYINMQDKTLSFGKNGSNNGIAFTNLPSQVCLCAVITTNRQLTLL